MYGMGYEIDIVGTNLPLRIAQSSILERELRGMLFEVGNIIRRKIQDKMNGYPFKHSQGAMAGAVTIKINPEKLEVVIYNDLRRAPYAVYQEYGVRETPMVWLIGKTIPYKIIDGRFVYAGGKGRGPSLYGDKGVRFVRITAQSIGRINPHTGKPSWTNPGYPGKFFYRDGLVESLIQIRQRFSRFTFRVIALEAPDAAL